jgi:hypothetical protein
MNILPHRGDLTWREMETVSRDLAAKCQASTLNQALACIAEAQFLIGRAAKFGRMAESRPLTGQIAREARKLICSSYNHLYAADVQSLPTDDEIIMGHVRKAKSRLKRAMGMFHV